jgi:hypothetical protein
METFNQKCQRSKVKIISETELKNSGGHESRNPLNHYFGVGSYHQLRASIPFFSIDERNFPPMSQVVLCKESGPKRKKV